MATMDGSEPTPDELYNRQPPLRPPIARAAARVRPPHRTAYRVGPHSGRGVARVPRPRELTSRFVLRGPSARPVFVDDTGRRGRLLSGASVVLALLALLLIAAFWLSQATWTGTGRPLDGCDNPATPRCGTPSAGA